MKKYNLEGLKVTLENFLDLQRIEVKNKQLIIQLPLQEFTMIFNDKLEWINFDIERLDYLDVFEFAQLLKYDYEI